MKKILNILIISSLSVLAGCNVVDLTPNNQYDQSYGFKTIQNADLYLNNFYPMVRDFGQFGSNALGGSNSNMSDGLTDILKYGSIVAGAGDCNLIMTVDGQQSVSQNYFDSWTTCYGWVRKVNEFLLGLEQNKGNFNQEQYNRLKAEALFFRSYAYFLIMRTHASVKDDLGFIIHTDINTMNPANKNKKRASVKESYDLIEKDLAFAMENLPEPANAGGRLNRYAACALQARAMLYAERYAVSKAAAKQVIDSGVYGYIDDYSAIFKDLNNKEVIFGYGFAKGTLIHSFDSKYSQPGDYCLSGSKGGGQAGPTQQFVDSYDYADGREFNVSDVANRYITNDNVGNRDPRLAASVLYNGALWKGRALECYEGGIDQKYMPYGQVNSPGNTVTGYYMKKLLDESNMDYAIDGSYQPWIEFRYAEVCLIYAECCAKDGDYGTAFDMVKELRQSRFGKEDVYTKPISSWESALDVILKERSIELCFEGHRFWDLRRTGRAVSVLDGKKYTGVLWKKSGNSYTAAEVSCEMGARKYAERFDRFPIPQSEIRNNGEIKQNSDW